MTDEPPTYAQQAIGIVVPATARHFVAMMAQMEECDLDAATRWEFLKRRLIALGREPQEAPR